MKAFGRVFKYVWPQWNRLLTIVTSAIIIAALYALSLATISPLLTVMMGEEGLHGWANRKLISSRCGLKFYVSDAVDLSDPNNPQVTHYLQISKVEHKSLAQKAGLNRNDRIIGAGKCLVQNPQDKFTARRLLSELASTKKSLPISIQIETGERGNEQIITKTLQAGKLPFYAPLAQSILRSLPDDNSPEHKKKAVIFTLLLMLVVTVIRCIARYLQDYTVQKVVNTSLAFLREDAFKHSLEIPVGFFSDDGSSDTVSRLIRDAAAVGNGIKVLLGKALREPLKALALIISALYVDRNLTLIFLCVAPVSLFVLVTLGKKIKRATKRSLQNWAVMLGKLEEAVAAIKVVKVYNRQEYEHGIFEKINRKLLKQQFRIAKVDSAAGPILESLGMLAASIGLIIAAAWVFGGAMASADFFMLLFFLGGAADSIRRTSDVWNRVQQADAAAVRVYSIIDHEPEQQKPNAFILNPLKEKIEFQNVRFRYSGTTSDVLDGINLTVKAGHNIAIVGPNGSGKTTLINLIPRFYDCRQGKILIDGKDIRDVTLFSLRDQIGMVTQQAITFNATIAENIAYGNINASDDEIIQAAKRSFAHEFIEPLPQGYNALIGEHGAGLSGGQLQRIVIARAILKNPAILIFDEATSQVDADSEAKIHKAIQEIMRDRTSFIIAHRFSTVVNADVIVVMDKGKIVAQGPHDELIKNCLLYQTLYETQLVKA